MQENNFEKKIGSINKMGNFSVETTSNTHEKFTNSESKMLEHYEGNARKVAQILQQITLNLKVSE